MMNGSVVLCNHLDMEARTCEMSLSGLFMMKPPFDPFSFDCYAHFAPERLGRHQCEFRFYDHQKQKSQTMKYQDADITAMHIEQRYFGIYVTKLFMQALQPGQYSIDFYVNDILTASHPLKITGQLQ